jgi:hypothetical protein
VEREGKPWVCARRYNHPRSRKGGNKKALLCCFAGLSNYLRLSTDDTKVTSAIACREKLDPLRREMPWVRATRRRTALLVGSARLPCDDR